MWEWIKSWFINETTETNTINPNSMSPIPKGKFFNYVISKAEVDEDSFNDYQ